jgi:hypothetical protein
VSSTAALELVVANAAAASSSRRKKERMVRWIRCEDPAAFKRLAARLCGTTALCCGVWLTQTTLRKPWPPKCRDFGWHIITIMLLSLLFIRAKKAHRE